MTRTVYADHAATTPVCRAALEAMTDYIQQHHGNPSGLHSSAQAAKRVLEDARERIAAAIGAKKNEIYFTSNGSEADNWAIKGAAELRKDRGRHIITSSVEHPAVIASCEHLRTMGYEVSYLPVDGHGEASADSLREALRDDTILVSVMMANNEIGTLQPIEEMARLCKEKDVLFHTDAVQTVGHLPVDVNELGVDMLTMAGHKFGGPKGAAALYVRQGIKLPPLIHGGGQERGRRGGTENVAAILGMAVALEESIRVMPEANERLTAMRDRLIEEVLKIHGAHLTGHPERRLPGNASFAFECIEGESAALMLNYRGIEVSTGSACSTGSLEASHVLTATGMAKELAHGSVRFSLGHGNTEEDIDHILEHVPVVVERLRSMSPLCNCGKKED